MEFSQPPGMSGHRRFWIGGATINVAGLYCQSFPDKGMEEFDTGKRVAELINDRLPRALPGCTPGRSVITVRSFTGS